MSDLHDLVPFAVFGFPAAVTIAFRWFKHRERMAAAPLATDARHAAALEARLVRVEQMLDAVVAETERVSEGQRFVTRLLAERPAGTAPERSPARSPERAFAAR